MAIMLTGNKADAEDLVQVALAFLAWDNIKRSCRARRVRTARDGQHAYIVVAAPLRRGITTAELPDQVVADHAPESDMAEVVRRALDRCRSGCAPPSYSDISTK